MHFRARQTHHYYKARAGGQTRYPEGQGGRNSFLDSVAPVPSPVQLISGSLFSASPLELLVREQVL